jgi:hypothetical protein
MTDFFADLDDTDTYAQELAKAQQAIARIKEKAAARTAPRNVRNVRTIPSKPTRKPFAPAALVKQASVEQALPALRRPLAPKSLPLVDPVVTAQKKTLSYADGLPGSELLPRFVNGKRVMPDAESLPASRAKTPVASAASFLDFPVSSESDILYVTEGGRKYLKDRDKFILTWIHDLEFPTTAHLIYLADSTANYFPRRLRQFDRDLNLIEKVSDPLRMPTWRLMEKGHHYVGGQFHYLQDDAYDLDPETRRDVHKKRQNANTIVAKLTMGTDESILFPSDSVNRHTPLPILTSRWIKEGAHAVSKHDGRLDLRREADIEALLGNKNHPREGAWKYQSEMRKGGLPQENSTLLSIYRNLDVSYSFASYDEDGQAQPDFNPDFVILRPLVESGRRADGRFGFSFNHDAGRVEIALMKMDRYKELLHDLYWSGMYGRLHEFTDRQEIKWALADAWDWLIDSGNVPRFTDAHGKAVRSGDAECWLQVHDLAEPLNNTGKGKDKYDEDGQLRAVSAYDG